MDSPTAFAIIALAALIQASFQVSISTITLLSGFSMSKKQSGRRTLRLVFSFFAGSTVMTMLIVSFLALVASVAYRSYVPSVAWATVSGAMIGLGVAVWAFYYRRRAGTVLWIPRPMARFLAQRAASTKSSAESFSLGLTSITAELLFMIAPAAAAALALTYVTPRWQLAGLLLYVALASLGLGIVTVLIGSGRPISTIQRWREQNKRFLQFIAGSGGIVLGVYIYATMVAVVASTATGIGFLR